MEYLPLPEDPALQPIEIKFQDPEKYWYDGTWKEHIDGTYWYNFPARYGYELGDFWIEHGEQSNQAWAHRGFWTWIMNQPRAKLEGIAIGWLYFGTLAEVTRCALDIKDYLHTTDDGEQVLKLTSQMMDHHLIRWLAISSQFNGSVYIRGSPYRDPNFQFAVLSEAFVANRDGLQTQFGATLDENIEFQAKLDRRGRSLQFERAHRCLQRSKAIIKLLCETIDPKTAYVIASLHEFLATAMGVIFNGEVTECYNMDERGRWSLGSWVEFDFALYNRDVMQALGWCPRTIEHVLTRHDRSLALDYFATNLKSHQTSEDHSKCSKDICVAYQLDSDAYTVKHTTDHPACECAHLEMDLNIAAAILHSGPDGFPLVAISSTDTNGSASMEVKNAAAEAQYVAVSHVWSQGLGNPKKNSLPKCQLQRIQRWVNNLVSKAGPEQDPVPFWMDSLCCPRLPLNARRDAILKMAVTYERASHVLVLDQNLASVSTTRLSTLEILMRVFRSAWTQRLWTLQEAKLAQQVWFQFKDRAVNLEHTLKDSHNMDLSDSLTTQVVAQQVIASLYVKWDGLRSFERLRKSTGRAFLPDYDSAPKHMRDFASLCYSLSGRSTSEPTDEAICICSLMGLDLKPILDISVDEPSCASLRMRAMWKQWSALPQAMIFNHAPRLPYKGYRWAHSTFIRTRGSWIPFVGMDINATIDTEGEGLLVALPAFVLQAGHVPLVLAEHDIRLRPVPKGSNVYEPGGVLTFMMYEFFSWESVKWYDVQILQPVHKTMPNFNRTAEVAVIFSDDKDPDHSYMSGLLVSIRKKDPAKGIVYASSLYHVVITRSEPVVDKLFTGALRCQSLLGTLASNGQIRALESRGLWDDSARCAAILIIVMLRQILDDPEVKAAMIANIHTNQIPEQLAWLNDEGLHKDWCYRCMHGDVHILRGIVDVWIRASSGAKLLSRGTNTFCVD